MMKETLREICEEKKFKKINNFKMYAYLLYYKQIYYSLYFLLKNSAYKIQEMIMKLDIKSEKRTIPETSESEANYNTINKY